MLVLSSPSGAGKTTISRRLLERDGEIELSISVTTRARRPGEVDGRDYHFIDEAGFQKLVREEALLEYASVFDHHYGTPAPPVRERLERGADILFDIDWQGTRQLAQKNREDLVSVFILPPDMRELERRLLARAQDDASVVARRMGKAAGEIGHWREYDYVLLNDDLETTIAQVGAILQAERLKRVRQKALDGFVASLLAA